MPSTCGFKESADHQGDVRESGERKLLRQKNIQVAQGNELQKQERKIRDSRQHIPNAPNDLLLWGV